MANALLAITWPLLFVKPFQALVGRMTHQSVLADFIPLRRRGDAGNYWHLEMATLSVLTATQNVLCTTVIGNWFWSQLFLHCLQEQEHQFPQEGLVAKQTLMPKLAVMIFTASVLRASIMVLKLVFAICQTNYPFPNSEVSDFFIP